MAKGSRGGKRGVTLSTTDKQKITNDIVTHSITDNDRAERNLTNSLDAEKKYVDNYSNYVKTGYIKSKNDPWFKDHVDSYNYLKSTLDFFKKERKRTYMYSFFCTFAPKYKHACTRKSRSMPNQ